MDYFYIMCSVASVVALLGYIRDKFVNEKEHSFAYKLLGIFVLVTLVFWVWFYFAPQNSIKSKIEHRIYSIQHFTPANGDINISTVEGKFDAYSWNEEVVVFIPSFVEPPVIYVKRLDVSGNFQDPSSQPLKIFNITTDSFSYSGEGSDQHGQWVYRARGKLLKSVKQSP